MLESFLRCWRYRLRFEQERERNDREANGRETLKCGKKVGAPSVKRGESVE